MTRQFIIVKCGGYQIWLLNRTSLAVPADITMTKKRLRLECARSHMLMQSVLHQKCIVYGGENGEDEGGL